jgi:AcrR family transcriptional regulator
MRPEHAVASSATTMASTPASTDQPSRQRVPAAERRDALIDAAIHEFAHGGLHGTPVERIARRVGVAQPYVFSLFASKRELFLAAVERDFQLTEATFTRAVAGLDSATAPPDDDVLHAIGKAYVELLASNRDYLMLQHQAYAACDEPEIRERVRTCYARLVAHVEDLSGAAPERIDEFIGKGMWLNVAAAMEVEEFSPAGPWVRAQLDGASNQPAR